MVERKTVSSRSLRRLALGTGDNRSKSDPRRELSRMRIRVGVITVPATSTGPHGGPRQPPVVWLSHSGAASQARCRGFESRRPLLPEQVQTRVLTRREAPHGAFARLLAQSATSRGETGRAAAASSTTCSATSPSRPICSAPAGERLPALARAGIAGVAPEKPPRGFRRRPVGRHGARPHRHYRGSRRRITSQRSVRGTRRNPLFSGAGRACPEAAHGFRSKNSRAWRDPSARSGDAPYWTER